jgi:hypothetical protein
LLTALHSPPRRETFPNPFRNTIKHYNMQILFSILLALPLALASPTARGCGTIVDETGLGQTLIGDQKCNSMSVEAKSISVGEGCLCVTFSSDECSGTKFDTWTYLVTGPNINKDLTDRGTQWYQCSTDILWKHVSDVI